VEEHRTGQIYTVYIQEIGQGRAAQAPACVGTVEEGGCTVTRGMPVVA
jgi:hypothetical protein